MAAKSSSSFRSWIWSLPSTAAVMVNSRSGTAGLLRSFPSTSFRRLKNKTRGHLGDVPDAVTCSSFPRKILWSLSSGLSTWGNEVLSIFVQGEGGAQHFAGEDDMHGGG